MIQIHLVRHGSAGVRNDADPDDCERHLDATGLRQAVRIAQELAPLDPESPRPSIVVSSPAARCVETVEPLASSVGVALEVDDRLFEGTDVDHAWRLVEEIVDALRSDGATDAALCSHGDVIPELVRRAQGRGMHVPGRSGCSKGSWWTLTWNDDHFTVGVYQPNPA